MSAVATLRLASLFLLGLATAAPSAAAGGNLSVDPVPVPAQGEATVTASFDEPVEEAEAVACRADGDRAILSCFRPVGMESAGDEWTARVPPAGGFGDAALAGFNATGRTADGDPVHVPGGGASYRFVEVASMEQGRGIPAAGGLGAAALAAAALRGRD